MTHALIQHVLLPLARSLREFGASFSSRGAAPPWPPLALESAPLADCGGGGGGGLPPRWASRLAELAAGSGAGGAFLERLRRRGGGSGDDGGGGRAAGAGGALEDALGGAVWLAVPKRKTSYSKKRQRQMSPHYAREDLTNFYPCPKCDKGLLKLRHHICPCDQMKLNVSGVKQVRWAGARARAFFARAPHRARRPPAL